MAENVGEVVTQVMENNSKGLADAGTTEAVGKLTTKIAREVEERFDGTKDKFSYRAVIVILGFVVAVVAVTYAIYALTPVPVGQKTHLVDLPDALISLGAAAIGALAGLLAPAPR